jgi:membrane-associated phospholipid phosphatase
MGLTGPLVFLFPLFGWKLLWTLPLIVLLGWARVALRSHTVAQVIAGAIAGVGLTLLQTWVIVTLLLPLMK